MYGVRGQDSDRVCISWLATRRGAQRCRAWEYRWAEDAQTPADKIEDGAARELAQRERRPYIPPHHKHESASDYLARMGDERRRADAAEHGECFIPTQRHGESFDHYSKRFFDETMSGTGHSGLMHAPQSSSFSSPPPVRWPIHPSTAVRPSVSPSRESEAPVSASTRAVARASRGSPRVVRSGGEPLRIRSPRRPASPRDARPSGCRCARRRSSRGRAPPPRRRACRPRAPRTPSRAQARSPA